MKSGQRSDRERSFDTEGFSSLIRGVQRHFRWLTAKDVGRPVVGPEFAGWAAERAGIPVVAIGGITLTNVSRLAGAGCRNVAIVSALSSCARPAVVVRSFLRVLAESDPEEPD